MRIVVLLLLGFMTSLPVVTIAQQTTRRICDTIHYEYVHDKIIIPVIVNGVKVKYIVDTGGQTGTIRENAVEMKAMSGGTSRGVSDLNGMSLAYEEAVLSNVQLSSNYKLTQMKSMVFPSNGFFRELGVVGRVGSDAFAQAGGSFDAREQIMIINYPYRPDGLKISAGIAIYPGRTSHPIVDVDFGGITKRVLFDTGANGLLILSADDYEDLKDKVENRLLSCGIGISGVGIGGFDLKNTMKMKKVSIGKLNFVGKEFNNIESVTCKGRSLMGVDMLNYGKVVIDYMRNRFYFFPYESGTEDMTGELKNWNVGILPVKGHFEITAVWDSAKDLVALGDQVIRVNGKNLSELEQSQLEVEALLDAVEGNVAEIVILKDGKEKKVTVTVAETPSDEATPVDSKQAQGKLGVSVRALNPEELKELELPNGLLVTDVRGAAARAGLMPRDIIISANGKSVKTTSDLINAVKKADKVALLVQRQNSRIFIAVDLK